MKRRTIAFNGKFLAAAPTGVHRVARELILGVDLELRDRPSLAESPLWQVLKPKDAFQTLSLERIQAKTVGLTTWQPWEQLELPIAARGQLLINLCNLAPLAHAESVTMIHDAQVFSSPTSYGAAFRTWYRIALPIIGRRSLRILTVSEFSRRQLADYGVADYDRISVIHNGVDHLRAVTPDPSAVERFSLKDKPFVLALANVQSHKNVALLMRTFADPRLASFNLVLVGKATAEDFQNASAPPPPNAVFVGSIDDASFRGLMERAVCFAFPSTTEGFGLPPLEAMSLECPAVVAPCGSLPEVCADATLYAGPDDANGWVEAIVSLKEDASLRARMVQMGKEQSARFTWRAAAKKLLMEIDQLKT